MRAVRACACEMHATRAYGRCEMRVRARVRAGTSRLYSRIANDHRHIKRLLNNEKTTLISSKFSFSKPPARPNP